MSFLKLAAPAAALGLLAGCAHAPAPAPMTALVPGLCAPAFSLEGAKATQVVMAKEAKISLGAASDCMRLADGQPTLYAVFRLPDAAEPYLITIRSLPIGQGLVIPRLMLMADNGVVLRTIEGERFTFHGASMMTKLRSHPGEAYLVVAVDTRYVGQAVSQIAESFVQTAGTSFIGKAIVHTTSTAGSSNTVDYVFSYNGDLVVSAEPVPKA
jgi:hypothetical protein